MVIGAHRHGLTVHTICNSVIENVTNNVNVLATHRVVDKTLTLTCAESGAKCLNEVGILACVSAPFLEVVIYLLCEFLAASHADHA